TAPLVDGSGPAKGFDRFIGDAMLVRPDDDRGNVVRHWDHGVEDSRGCAHAHCLRRDEAARLRRASCAKLARTANPSSRAIAASTASETSLRSLSSFRPGQPSTVARHCFVLIARSRPSPGYSTLRAAARRSSSAYKSASRPAAATSIASTAAARRRCSYW